MADCQTKRFEFHALGNREVIAHRRRTGSTEAVGLNLTLLYQLGSDPRLANLALSEIITLSENACAYVGDLADIHCIFDRCLACFDCDSFVEEFRKRKEIDALPGLVVGRARVRRKINSDDSDLSRGIDDTQNIFQDLRGLFLTGVPVVSCPVADCVDSAIDALQFFFTGTKAPLGESISRAHLEDLFDRIAFGEIHRNRDELPGFVQPLFNKVDHVDL